MASARSRATVAHVYHTHTPLQDLTYEVVPRIDRQVCLAFAASGDVGPDDSALPDVRGWEFGGTQQLNGQEVELWQHEARWERREKKLHQTACLHAALRTAAGRRQPLPVFTCRHEAKHVLYRYYVSPDGTPRRLDMHGTNALSGAHFDHWWGAAGGQGTGRGAERGCRAPTASTAGHVLASCRLCLPASATDCPSVAPALPCSPCRVVDYTHFAPGRPDPALFEPPALCAGVRPAEAPGAGAPPAHLLRLRSLIPAVKYSGDAEVGAGMAGTPCSGQLHMTERWASPAASKAQCCSACSHRLPLTPPLHSTTPFWRPTARAAATPRWPSTTRAAHCLPPTSA